MDHDALPDHVAVAIGQARGHATTTDWDRQAAGIAIRRWNSFGRRQPSGKPDARVADLARGLLERLDPNRMDAPGWHVWVAEAAARVLDEGPPRR